MAYSILHIADPHFGRCHFAYTNPRQAGEEQARELEHQLKLNSRLKRKFDALILSGDFTFGCGDHGFAAAVAFVEAVQHLVQPGGILAIPGNHDINLGKPLPIRKLSLPIPKEEAELNYRKHFLRPLEGLLGPPCDLLSMVRRFHLRREPRGLVIVGLNSCRVERWDAQGFGYVGLDQIEEIFRLLLHPQTGEPGAHPGDLVLVVTHHNPLPVWDIGIETLVRSQGDRKFSFMMDAASVLEMLADLGVGIVLHGHTHKRSYRAVSGYATGLCGRDRPIRVLGSGSIGVLDGMADPAHHFQIIDINDNKLRDTGLTARPRLQNQERQWVLEDPVDHSLFSFWEPDRVHDALAIHAPASKMAAERIAISQSWSQLRAKPDHQDWRRMKSTIVDKVLSLCSRANRRHVETQLERLFDEPPPESKMCELRLEQYLAGQLRKKK